MDIFCGALHILLDLFKVKKKHPCKITLIPFIIIPLYIDDCKVDHKSYDIILIHLKLKEKKSRGYLKRDLKLLVRQECIIIIF